ncbi:hypothetical protein [Streptomyces sp. NPDC091259]|uniref:hypothetical protein n=1 Tax=Streptomyces sp. NPDC091259 TaxID=3365976 RepID=UPI00382538D2
MTTWTGGRVIGAAALLGATGVFLMYAGLHQADTLAPAGRTSAAAAPAATGTPMPTSQAAATSHPENAGPESTVPVRISAIPPQSAPPQAPSAGGPVRQNLPPPGSGPAADPLIQQALDQASPRDLPADEERRLLDLGRTAWLGETAGYSRVRIQAATVRRDNTPAVDPRAQQPLRAVVRLVWAGADPAGTFLDGRTATVTFAQNGDRSWTRIS